MKIIEQYSDWLTRHSWLVIVVLLATTAVVGAGATDVETGLSIASFGSDSEEAQRLDYVEANFSTEGENTTAVQVVYRGGDALSRESLIAELQLQRAIRESDTAGPTLAKEQSFAGLSNLVARTAIRQEQAAAGGRQPAGAANASAPPARTGTTPQAPTIDEQLAQLESMSQSEIDRVLAQLLAADSRSAGPADPYALLPTSFDSESLSADARVLFVFQQTPDSSSDSLSPAVVDGQLEITQLVAQDRYDGPGEAFAFGAGIVDEEASNATGDSFALISPVALLLVLTVLFVAYRDPLDVALGLAGVVLVLVWMAGVMGWAGIGVTQILIAVPFLLIGLSIDYALHVVMRYREARQDDPSLTPQEGMQRGLVGVTVALAATTFTTAVGFLANLTSPIQSIQEFGLVSAAGIVSAFLVFAVLLPAVKLTLDQFLERLGLDRRKRAFGRAGATERVLGVGTALAKNAPVVVVIVGLVLTLGGGYAATEIETSISQEDFLPRETPDWTESLPEPFRPGEYDIRENVVYVNDNFAQSRDSAQVELLVQGDVTAPDTLDRLRRGDRAVANTSSAVTLGDGEPRTTNVLSVIERTKQQNESFAALVAGADTDGDGVPDSNLEQVYDALYAAAPADARSVLYRTGDGYQALRMQVAVQGDASTSTVTEEMRAVATTIEGDSALTVTATGQPIIQEIVQNGLLETLVQGFLITLGVILVFLVAIFWRRHDQPALGVVTMVPVAFALAWVLGAMYLLGIGFNTETAIITSIAIGLGVDYAIHVSERFLEELAASGDPDAALDRTVAGTGGALLASAVTTAAGFGVLALALVPSLRRFGLVMATAIAFAFVASVVLLPSLLTLWSGWSDTDHGTVDPAAAD